MDNLMNYPHDSRIFLFCLFYLLSRNNWFYIPLSSLVTLINSQCRERSRIIAWRILSYNDRPRIWVIVNFHLNIKKKKKTQHHYYFFFFFCLLFLNWISLYDILYRVEHNISDSTRLSREAKRLFLFPFLMRVTNIFEVTICRLNTYILTN